MRFTARAVAAVQRIAPAAIATATIVTTPAAEAAMLSERRIEPS